MKLELKRRGVEVRFRFGETQIDVWAFVIETGEPVHVEFDFEKLESLAV